MIISPENGGWVYSIFANLRKGGLSSWDAHSVLTGVLGDYPLKRSILKISVKSANRLGSIRHLFNGSAHHQPDQGLVPQY